jgi:5-hydroxyisourate hydrolase
VSEKAAITTHVLDQVRGKPAAGILVRLYDDQVLIAEGVTDDDGRVVAWQQPIVISSGKYRLEFDVADWFEERGETSFYEDVHISFRVDDPAAHYHVPLLLSPFGYSTYRGS